MAKHTNIVSVHIGQVCQIWSSLSLRRMKLFSSQCGVQNSPSVVLRNVGGVGGRDSDQWTVVNSQHKTQRF